MIKHKNLINNLIYVITIGACFLYLVFIHIAGGNVIYNVIYNICFLFSVVLSGYYILKSIIKDKDDGFYILAGLPIGIFLTILTGIFFSPLILVVFSIFMLLKNFKKEKLKFFANDFDRNILLLTFSAFLVIYIFVGVLSFAKPSEVGRFLYHQDMLWSVGNAASVFNGFPFEDMRLANTTLNYHYFNDVLAGMIGKAIGVNAYESLCFYYYPNIMAFLIYAIYYISKKISKNNVISSFIPVVVLFVASATSEMQINYILNMNGQGSASLVLVSFLLIIDYVINKKINIKNISLAFISIIVLTMFKSTVGALAICALFAGAIVYKLMHKDDFNKLFYSIVSLIGFLICNYFIFSKAINNLVFIGFTEISSIFDLFFNAPLIALVFIISAFYYLFKIKELSFLELVFFAGAVGGTIAYTLFKHYSFSEIYFLLTAIFFMAIIISKAINEIKSKKIIIIGLSIISLVFSLITLDRVAVYAGNGIQATLNIFNLTNDPYDESYISKFDEEAMIWLRDNTEQETIFATNRNNKYLSSGDGIFHYYTAVSQRRAFIESYRYTMDYSGMYHEVVRRLEDVSDNIFFNLNEEEAFSLAIEEGIDYLVVNKIVSNVKWEKEPVFENEEVIIYKTE